MAKTNVKVRLTERDGNAFAVLGNVIREMKRKGVDKAIIDEYKAEATKGDYDHLLMTTMDYVDVA